MITAALRSNILQNLRIFATLLASTNQICTADRSRRCSVRFTFSADWQGCILASRPRTAWHLHHNFLRLWESLPNFAMYPGKRGLSDGVAHFRGSRGFGRTGHQDRKNPDYIQCWSWVVQFIEPQASANAIVAGWLAGQAVISLGSPGHGWSKIEPKGK